MVGLVVRSNPLGCLYTATYISIVSQIPRGRRPKTLCLSLSFRPAFRKLESNRLKNAEEEAYKSSETFHL